MKKCSNCGISKEDSKFYKRKSGDRVGDSYNHCIDCLRTRGREYYAANRDRQLQLSNERRRVYRKTRHLLLLEIKNRPCVDCGLIYPPYVMDFDHRNGTKKRGNVADLVNRNFLTIEKLLNEISECDIVCANCHRIRTFTRTNTKINVK